MKSIANESTVSFLASPCCFPLFARGIFVILFDLICVLSMLLSSSLSLLLSLPLLSSFYFLKKLLLSSSSSLSSLSLEGMTSFLRRHRSCCSMRRTCFEMFG